MHHIVANRLGHGLYIIQDGKFLWINESFAEMFGYSKEEILNMSYSRLISPDHLDFATGVLCKFHSGEMEQISFEIRGLKEEGSILDISVTKKVIQYEGKPALIGSVIDISERKKMELELKENKERYQTLVENSPLGILVHQKGVIKYANPMAVSLLGANNSKDIMGRAIYSIVHPDYAEIVAKRINSVEQGKKVPTLYEKFIRRDGQELDVEVKGMPIQLNGVSAVQIVFWDVTEKKKEEDLIRYRAYHDTLTDLPNRNKFEIDFAEEMNNDRTFTIMYLSFEELKFINDFYGRQAGDLVLIKVGARLAGMIGFKGIVYRMGGAEFAVVLAGKIEEVNDMAGSMANIVNQPLYVSNTTVRVSPSIGVVFYPDHGTEIDMLLRHANMAMNFAKKTKTLYKKYDH